VMRVITALLDGEQQLAHSDQILKRVDDATTPNTWVQAATASMFMDPIVVGKTGWTNGQHRGQAILDSGAHQALVIWTL
ncbi:MAG: hypothetical protein ACRCYU_24110, partial [Nocardioides sp.]